MRVVETRKFMINKRQKCTKQSIAILLILLLIAGFFQGLGSVREVKAAETPASLQYSKISINDFGFDEGRRWPGPESKQKGTYAGDLSGKYLDVDISFDGAQNWNTSFDYAAGTNGWGGVRVAIVDGGLYIYPATLESHQNQNNCIYYSATKAKVRDFTQTFNLKLALKYDGVTDGVAKNVTIHTWVNGVFSGYEYEEISLFGQTMAVHADAGTIVMETPKEIDTGYREIGIGDFDLGEIHTWSKDNQAVQGNYQYGDLQETCLNVDVRFSGTQDDTNTFDYATTGEGAGGIRVAVIEEELYLYPAADETALEDGNYIKYTAEEATLGSFAQTFNLKIALEYTTEVTVKTWVNYQAKEKTFASIQGLGLGIKASVSDGKIKLESPSNPSKLNVLTTPETFGIGYGTYNVENTSIARQDVSSTMDQVTLSSKMRFSGTSAYITMCSEDANGWEGLRFGTDTSNTSCLYLYDTKIGLDTKNGKGFAFSPDVAKTTLVGDVAEVQLSINYLAKHSDGIENDLQVGVWFEGKLYNNRYCVFPDVLDKGVSGGNYMAVALGKNSSLKLDASTEKECIPITLWDYALEDGNVSEGNNVDVGMEDIATLDKTTFAADIQFPANEGSGLRIGGWDSSHSWNGIYLYLSADGKSIYMQDLYKDTTGGARQDACLLTSETNLVGTWVRVSMDFRVLKEDLFVTFRFNNGGETTRCFPAAGPYAGSRLVIHSAAGTSVSYRSVGERKYVYKDAESYDLKGRDGYLISGVNVTVNGVPASNGDVLSVSGDYIIERTVKGKIYRQLVSLYRIGDVYTDNIAGSWADGVHLEDYVDGKRVISVAALKAADLNNDGLVDKEDLRHMRYIRADEAQAANRLAATINMYYPAALTYDFLGGNDVMPIYAFFGPTNTPSVNKNNLLTDQVYSYIKEAGINLITYTPDEMTNYSTQFPKMLEFGEKYGIGYYVADGRLNTAIDTSKNITNGAPLNSKQIAEVIDDYSFYSSYLGADLGDEPSANGFYYQSTEAGVNQAHIGDASAAVFPKGRMWQYYQDASKNMNRYVNTCGMMNHAPSDAPWLVDYYYSAGYSLTAFQNYWDNVYKTGNPKALAFDHYPFQDFNTEDVTNAGSFFKSLMITRQKSLQHDVPMWVLMAVGGCFEATDRGTIATPAEHLWNANTLLAFGAKGIGYFTLVQYETFCKNENGVIDESLNSVITYSGNKSPYFDTVKQINTQIKAVDEVLMKSRSKGVIATGGYSWTETYNDVEATYGTGTIISPAATKHLESYANSDGTYGAFIGCFDYKDTEAYYVVNYSVEQGQAVQLNFDNTYNYRYIKNGITTTAQSNSCNLWIEPGNGVLVVLDSPVTSSAVSAAPYDGTQYEITHRDFKDSTGAALTDRTYEFSGTSDSVTKVTSYNPYTAQGTAPTTINGTTFSTNVTYHGDADLRYGGTGADGWYGMMLYPVENGTQLEVCFERDPNNRPRKYVTAESVGLKSFLDTPFDLKMNVAIINADGGSVADDIRLGLYINGVMATGDYIVFNGFGEHLGHYFSLYVRSAGSSITLGEPQLDASAYKEVSLYDFGIGSVNEATDVKGTLGEEGLDKKIVSAKIDFNDSSSSLLLGGNDSNSETGIRFYKYQTGLMMMTTDRLQAYGGYPKLDWGFGIPTDRPFHLCVTTDYVDFDKDGYKDDVKLSVWVDSNLIHGNFFLPNAVHLLGDNLVLKGNIDAHDAAVVEDLGSYEYELSEGNPSYTVPGTDITYTEPGEYTISYEQEGTQYRNDIILYRAGDVKKDEALDLADLIRAKKDLPVLSLSDISIAFKGGYIPEGAETRGQFKNVDTIVGSALEFRQIFSDTTEKSQNGSLRLGQKTADSWYGFFLSYDDEKDLVKVEYWNPQGERMIEEEIEGITILPGEEHRYRVEITADGEDVFFAIYIDENYCGKFAAEGQKGQISNYVLAYTEAGSPFSVRDIGNQKIIEKSADVDKNGCVEGTEVAGNIRSLLVGKTVETPIAVGALSDVHLLGDGSDSTYQKHLLEMLRYYKENDSDVIMVSGDITNAGQTKAYQIFADIVERVYVDVPKEERPKFIMTAGNNDYYEGWTWGGNYTSINTLKERFATGLSSLNENLTGANINTCETLDGYTFIGVSADSLKYGVAGYSASTLKWLKAQLKAAAQTSPEKPIFVSIAQPPSDTVIGSELLGTDAYEEILEEYPQVVLLTGQTHAPLQAERSIYQEDYTIVNTGSMSYVGGFEGGCSTAENIDATCGQALQIYARDSQVEIWRYDVTQNKTIGKRWLIENVADKNTFIYTEDRFANKKEAPVFDSEAKAVAKWTKGQCRLDVSAATHSEYVYYYEVQGSSGNVWRFASDFYKGSVADYYKFTLNGATTKELFKVYAVDAYGNRSKALVAN